MSGIRSSCAILGATAALAVLCSPTAAQGVLPGVSERFSELWPARAKTFIRSSSDPDELGIFPTSPVGPGNDDGFSGTNDAEAYRKTFAGADTAVLAHLEGRSGHMALLFRNYWTGVAGAPLWPLLDSNRAQIEVDGTIVHDRLLEDFFRNQRDPRGQLAPFDGPFTGNRAGGHLTHTPVPFQDSLIVRVFENDLDNAARFHKVGGAYAAPGEAVPLPDLAAWEQVHDRIGRWRHDAPRVARTRRLTLPADNGIDNVRLTGPATILELSCRFADPADLDGIRLRCFWDGATTPAVDVPLRLLAGRGPSRFAQPAQDGLMWGHDADRRLWFYLPMHFTQDAVLEFENRSTRPVAMDLDWAQVDGPHPGVWGHFHATYHSGVTRSGVTFRGPRIEGRRGMLRALVLESGLDTSGRIGFFDITHLEGDLGIRINGNRGDDHVFAATETSVGKWGWYGTFSDVPFVRDTSFNTGFGIRVEGNLIESHRIQGSLFVFDPVHFVDGIEIVLEHGVQNAPNADYGLVSMFYLEPGGPARETVLEIDVGDAADEAAKGVTFPTGTAPRFELDGTFFRDWLFQVPGILEDGREVQQSLAFPLQVPGLAGYQGLCVGFRLDREKIARGSFCQAEVFVDGVRAGLLHSWTSNALHRWKEGGELEVELPRALTDGKASMVIEVRPVTGTDPLRVGGITVHGYTRG